MCDSSSFKCHIEKTPGIYINVSIAQGGLRNSRVCICSFDTCMHSIVNGTLNVYYTSCHYKSAA